MAKPMPNTTMTTPSAQNVYARSPNTTPTTTAVMMLSNVVEEAVPEDEADRLRADDGAEDEAEDREDRAEQPIAEERGDEADGDRDQRDEPIHVLYHSSLCGRAPRRALAATLLLPYNRSLALRP